MANVKETATASHSVYEQNGKWHDGFGGEHFTQADAIHAIESRISDNQNKGINTLSKADGVAMLVYVLFVCGLGYATFWHFVRGQFFSSIGFAAGCVIAVFVFFRFFMHTLPSFRIKMYVLMVFLLIASHFILLKFFNITLL